jgi:hypothetical protein
MKRNERATHVQQIRTNQRTVTERKSALRSPHATKARLLQQTLPRRNAHVRHVQQIHSKRPPTTELRVVLRNLHALPESALLPIPRLKKERAWHAVMEHTKQRATIVKLCVLTNLCAGWGKRSPHLLFLFDNSARIAVQIRINLKKTTGLLRVLINPFAILDFIFQAIRQSRNVNAMRVEEIRSRLLQITEKPVALTNLSAMQAFSSAKILLWQRVCALHVQKTLL